MIKWSNDKTEYFDKNGTPIVEGCLIKYPDGKVKKVYLTENDELGTDATNPSWIENGRAVPCEYGVYPLEYDETNSVEVVKML